MGLFGSSGLKSLFSLASLVGQDIVAKSLTLTQDILARNITLSGTGSNSISGPTTLFKALTVRTVGQLLFSADPDLNIVSIISSATGTLLAAYLRSTANNEALAIGGGRNAAGSATNHIQNSTSGYTPFVTIVPTISPASGSGNFTVEELNPTINGTSSGVATVLAVAPVVTAFTGGTVNLVDFGTTTTNYNTGFTSKFKVDSSGNARIAGNLGVGNSAAGSTLGSVVKKVQIFDASGASLGFVPVYDAIT